MTEREWLQSTDPISMLISLRDTASDRKLRLFAITSSQRVPEFPSQMWNRAIEIAERQAEGRAEPQEISLFQFPPKVWDDSEPGCWLIGQDPYSAAYSACSRATSLNRTRHPELRFGRIEEVPHQIALLRDIFGNPFRPVTLDTRWLTSSVLDLANGIYEDRAFDCMPILADALMDVGCANEDFINHCGGLGPHIRGCWVVDMLLGKE